MELHLSSGTILFLTFGLACLFAATLSHFINYINDRMNPDDPYAFLKKYLGKKVKYSHKKYKMEINGTVLGFERAKSDAGKGKPNINIVILDDDTKYRVSLYDEGKSWNLVT